MAKEKVNEVAIRCPHCNQRLLDAAYVVGTIKCNRCKQIVRLEVKKAS